MNKYCDPEALEKNWFYWMVSSQSPDLDPIRNNGILWTRIMGHVKDKNGNNILRNNKPLPDPSYPIRSHCIPFANPIYFITCNGVLQPQCIIVKSDQNQIIESKEIFYIPFEPTIKIPKGYFKEPPTEKSWHSLLIDINNICHGIANKFHQPTEEEKTDLVHEVIIQITNKLINGRLIYTPGRAPVFNLLTTAIYRCMYSAMNKKNNRKRHINNLLLNAKNGLITSKNRSLRAIC